MALDDHFNHYRGKAYTRKENFRGVMGLGEQATTDLFLKDGVYSLWSKDASNPPQDGALPGKNMYGIHPFYMGAATDDTWFGVFSNLAAAQDWRIKNNSTSGEVDVETFAPGGLGNLFIMMADAP